MIPTARRVKPVQIFLSSAIHRQQTQLATYSRWTPCATIARYLISRNGALMPELIHVPRPSKKARDPNRPANTLIMNQVSHLQHAERRLPLRYRTEIYTHAIQTEGEAAEYIREVTEAIHQAHADAAKLRAKRGFEIAASAAPAKIKTKAKNKTKI